MTASISFVLKDNTCMNTTDKHREKIGKVISIHGFIDKIRSNLLYLPLQFALQLKNLVDRVIRRLVRPH